MIEGKHLCKGINIRLKVLVIHCTLMIQLVLLIQHRFLIIVLERSILKPKLKLNKSFFI